MNGLVDRQLRGYLPHPEGMSAEQWVPMFRQAIANRRDALATACTEAAYAMAFSWHRDFAERLEALVIDGRRHARAAVRAGAGRPGAPAHRRRAGPVR